MISIAYRPTNVALLRHLRALPVSLHLARACVLALLMLPIGCLPSAPTAPHAADSRPLSVRYQVTFEPDLHSGHTQICFDGRAPRDLRPIAGEGPALLGPVRTREGRVLPRSSHGVQLGALAADECVHYRFELGARGFAASHEGEALLTSQDAWLLRPSAPSVASLELRLPSHASASLPWGGDGARTSLPASALELPGHVALGVFSRRQFEADGVQVDLAVLPGELAVGLDGLVRAITGDIRAVSSVCGHFPVSSLDVVVVPVGPEMDGEPPDPIAFGLVRRGGGASVMLLVRADASEEDVRRHWVAPHELSHLLLPLIDRRDAWLSEGFATYYQEVTRVRAGLEDEETAWARIVDGCVRGAADAQDEGALSLSQAAASMRETGHFRRVYWSGMAFALAADVRLRTRARPSSLDALLCAEGPVFRQTTATMPATTALRTLDRALGAPVLAPMGEAWSARADFPATAPLLARLGVHVASDGSVTLDDDAPLAAVRRAIMAGPPN